MHTNVYMHMHMHMYMYVLLAPSSSSFGISRVSLIVSSILSVPKLDGWSGREYVCVGVEGRKGVGKLIISLHHFIKLDRVFCSYYDLIQVKERVSLNGLSLLIPSWTLILSQQGREEGEEDSVPTGKEEEGKRLRFQLHAHYDSVPVAVALSSCQRG